MRHTVTAIRYEDIEGMALALNNIIQNAETTNLPVEVADELCRAADNLKDIAVDAALVEFTEETEWVALGETRENIKTIMPSTKYPEMGEFEDDDLKPHFCYGKGCEVYFADTDKLIGHVQLDHTVEVEK